MEYMIARVRSIFNHYVVVLDQNSAHCCGELCLFQLLPAEVFHDLCYQILLADESAATTISFMTFLQLPAVPDCPIYSALGLQGSAYNRSTTFPAETFP